MSKKKNPLLIWKNRNQILEGIKNNIFKSEHVEQIASDRFEICLRCDKLDDVGTECLVPGTAPCCGNCGCTLKLKIRALSSACPEGYWDSIMTHDEEYELNQKLDNE
jgi:hypothetical protein